MLGWTASSLPLAPKALLFREVRAAPKEAGENRQGSTKKEFGMLLRDSAHRGRASYEQVLRLTGEALGEGEERLAREQFVELVRTAERLSRPGSDPRQP